MNGTIEIFAIGILAALQLHIFYGFWLLFRNGKVYTFRTMIVNLESKRHIEAVRQGLYFKPLYLHDKYSYNDMLYSFRPLKLRKWFTEEEIKYLTTPIER